MKTRTLVTIIILLSIVFLLSAIEYTYAKYWPTKKWKTSTPEKQAMNSSQLQQINEYVKEKLPATRSVLVVRNGFVVFEEYYTGDQDDRGTLWSATKSVTSALIGIALEKGYLDSIDQKMVDFFPEFETEALNPQVREITIRHLLTMTAGFGHDSMGLSNPDHIGTMLESQLQTAPGQVFAYNSTSSNLLSMIITKATGMTALEFGESYLFEPLGISNLDWTDIFGYTIGSQSLSMTTRDMAKVGYLYLNEGIWGKRQIIPKEWVEESTQTQVEVPNNEQVIDEDYGYQWWTLSVNGHSAYAAWGYNGQHIYVIPDLDIVIAITATMGGSTAKYLSIVDKFVVPAVMN